MYLEITTKYTGIRYKNKDIYYSVAMPSLLMIVMAIQMLLVYLKLLTVICIIVYLPMFI